LEFHVKDKYEEEPLETNLMNHCKYCKQLKH